MGIRAKLVEWLWSTRAVYFEAATSEGEVIAEIYPDGVIDLHLDKGGGEFTGAPETTAHSSSELAELLLALGLPHDEAGRVAEEVWTTHGVDDLLLGPRSRHQGV